MKSGGEAVVEGVRRVHHENYNGLCTKVDSKNGGMENVGKSAFILVPAAGGGPIGLGIGALLVVGVFAYQWAKGNITIKTEKCG